MFFKKKLQRKAIESIDNERVVRYVSLTEISSLIFLFDINEERILDTIKQLCSIADSRSIKFSGLALNYNKHPYPDVMLDHRILVVNKTDLNYYGVPRSTVVDSFTEKESELYIDFHPQYNFTGDFISRKSRAFFKLGRVNYPDNPYDLTLENINEKSSRNYLNSIIHYLSSIKSVQ